MSDLCYPGPTGANAGKLASITASATCRPKYREAVIRCQLESMQIWGLRRPSSILLDREIGVPTADHGRSLVVQGLDPQLEQQMCRAFRPLHLLFLTEPLTHHLINGRFDKAGADAFTITVALAIIRNETLIILDIGPPGAFIQEVTVRNNSLLNNPLTGGKWDSKKNVRFS
jgi:hypothetical protein